MSIPIGYMRQIGTRHTHPPGGQFLAWVAPAVIFLWGGAPAPGAPATHPNNGPVNVGSAKHFTGVAWFWATCAQPRGAVLVALFGCSDPIVIGLKFWSDLDPNFPRGPKY